MLQFTLLADEWKSSKGGLSTINRELAIELAKQPNVAVTLLVPKCGEADKNAACSHKIQVVEAEERPGFPPVDWLCFPPEDLVIDVIVGHGVPLGRQAQIIKKTHRCTWMQVVHTTPEELAMHKTYPDAISKGDEKQGTELKLCKMADFVVAIGPKLFEFYSVHLRQCGKTVFNLTPGIFTELSDLAPFTEETKKFRVLLFGRGDSEDFELKGLDIAAKAVAELNDRSYHLKFVGAPRGKEEVVRNGLLEQGLNRSRSQLTVKGFIENREELARLLSTANLVVIPSRTEGFGLTALEALSAGLPFLVSHNSGFGEALEEIPTGISWIIDSEDPEEWAKAIKDVREKGSKTALNECQELRTLYAKKYSWEKQCKDLVETIQPLVNAKLQASNSDQKAIPKEPPPDLPSSTDRTKLKEKLQTSNSNQGARPREAPPDPTSSIDRAKLKEKPQTSNNNEGARPREAPPDPPSCIGRTRLKDNLQTLNSEGPKPRQRPKQGTRPKESSPSSIDRTKLKAEPENPPADCVSQLERNRVEETSVQPSRRRNFLQEDQPITEQRTEDSLFSISNNTKQRRKLHVFNCDHTYSLESVKDLLVAVKEKLDFDPVVEKHYFSSSQALEMTKNRISKLRMDMAFYVVNAEESRLSINEDCAITAYTPVYRALLEAAGGRVLIVIGGDDRYRGEDEEERTVISRWARRKVASQFNEEYLDGRKSFIFSWNKQHREIHEEALLHYFDSSKVGQKFEYQPKPRQPQSDQSAQTTSERTSLLEYPVMDEQRGREGLAVLCCNLSEDSMHAVMQILQVIVPKQNLWTNPPVENLSPGDIKQYLTEAHLKACVLVVDGKAVKDAYEMLPQRKEYRGLLQTAANRVVEKLFILICDNCSLPPKDENIVSRIIEDIIIRRGKGHIAWLKNGKLSVDPDVLVQILTSPAPQPNPQTSLSRGFQEVTSDSQGSAAELFSSRSGQSQGDPFQRNRSDLQATTTIQPGDPPATCITGEPVLLRSLLRYGSISYLEGDLQLWDPAFTVPDDIKQNLSEQFYDTPVTGVIIVRGIDGKPEWSIDPKLIEISNSRYGKGIQMHYNENLMLKTRIVYGQVSFQESDVHYRFKNWQIPQDVIESLERDYCATPSGQLYIISDDRENVRWAVNIGIVGRARTAFNKWKLALEDRWEDVFTD